MIRNVKKKCLCAFLLFGIILTGYSQTGAENQNWRLSFGYEGYSFAGSWVPLFLTLKEPIPGGRLEIVRGEDIRSSNIESYELTHSGQYEFPIFIDEKVPLFNVKIYSGNLLLAEQTFYPSERLYSGHAVLVSSIPSAIRLSLSRMLFPREPILVLPVLPQKLPASGLSYDAVTALVISDPGPVLNQGQITAMGEWLALGGSVILLDPRKGTSSMLEQLRSQFTLTGTEGEQQLGLGTVHLIYSETIERKTLADSNFWKEKLNIVSASQSSRLRPGLVFGKKFDVFQKESAQNPLNKFILYIVVFWVIVLVGCGLFLKRRRISAGISLIFLLSIFTLIQRNKIAEVWNRGISIHIRELILPQNSGTLTSINLYSQDPSDVSIFLRKSSPFTSVFSFTALDSVDKGSMRFSAGSLFEWSHAGEGTGIVYDSSDRRTLRLTGFLPDATDSEKKSEALAKLRWINGNAEWQLPMADGTWKWSENPPPEISDATAWILYVSGKSPHVDWLVGIREVSDQTFGGMKWTGVTSLWITPETRQAQQ